MYVTGVGTVDSTVVFCSGVLALFVSERIWTQTNLFA